VWAAMGGSLFLVVGREESGRLSGLWEGLIKPHQYGDRYNSHVGLIRKIWSFLTKSLIRPT